MLGVTVFGVIPLVVIKVLGIGINVDFRVVVLLFSVAAGSVIVMVVFFDVEGVRTGTGVNVDLKVTALLVDVVAGTVVRMFVFFVVEGVRTDIDVALEVVELMASAVAGMVLSTVVLMFVFFFGEGIGTEVDAGLKFVILLVEAFAGTVVVMRVLLVIDKVGVALEVVVLVVGVVVVSAFMVAGEVAFFVDLDVELAVAVVAVMSKRV